MLDLDKPIQRRDGKPIAWGPHRAGFHSLCYGVSNSSGDITVVTVRDDGQVWGDHENDSDLINVPERVYRSLSAKTSTSPSSLDSKADAQHHAMALLHEFIISAPETGAVEPEDFVIEKVGE